MQDAFTISRERAGQIYRTTLISRGVTDPRLLDGMTEDFLKTVYDPRASGSSTPARDLPPVGGMGMPTPSPPLGKDDAFTPPPPIPFNPLGGGSANTGLPFFNALGGGSANTGLPPPVSASSIPVPKLRPELAGGKGKDTLRGGGGVDPLPQTSGHLDTVSRSGQESMNPAAYDLLKKLMAQGMV